MKANGQPGDKGLFTLELTIGDKKGERREIPMEILRPAPVAPLQDWFTVGSWGFNHVHVIDENAHNALIKSFVASGFNHEAGIYWDYVVEAEGTFVAAVKDKYRLNATVLRLVVFDYVDGQDDDVFNPRPEHDALFKEESFQDAYDREERPYHRDDR